MSDVVIRAENIGKRYRIGGPAEPYGTLRDTLVAAAAAPLRALRSGGRRGRREFWALRDVSFEVRQGEVLGIIGRNGAGKSTLLKILSRITEPTTGRIRIRGRIGSLLEVGTGFHHELSGRENIYLNGAILGMRKAEIDRKFAEIVDFAEIEQFLDTPVKRYSSGMYMRLAFSVAAHLDPEILIVDEVLAVGDAAFQRKCLGKIGDVARQGRTVLFVSHSIGALRNLCHRGMWLQSGQVQMTGPIIAVTGDYLNSTFRATSSALDLRDAARSDSTGEQLELKSLEVNEGRPIRHGDPLVIRLEYHAYRRLDGVAFGIGFSTIEGTRLMSLDSDLSGQSYTVERSGRGVVEMRLDALLLQPGRYVLDVGARSGGDTALDYRPACMHLEVVPGSDTPGFMIRKDGGVRMPARWSLTDRAIANVDGRAA